MRIVATIRNVTEERRQVPSERHNQVAIGTARKATIDGDARQRAIPSDVEAQTIGGGVLTIADHCTDTAVYVASSLHPRENETVDQCTHTSTRTNTHNNKNRRTHDASAHAHKPKPTFGMLILT